MMEFDFSGYLQRVSAAALPVLFALTAANAASAWMASRLGDPTARLAGRMTLNPTPHIDLFGTIIVPLLSLLSPFIIAWGKPLPADPRYLKQRRRDEMLISMAGPAANLLSALVWGFLFSLAGGGAAGMFSNGLAAMAGFGVMINVALICLNMLPLPPAAGGKLVLALLPPRQAASFERIEPYSFFIILGLLFTGLLSTILMVPYTVLINLIINLFK